MLMTPVNSSNLLAIGYDAVTQTLRIEFKNGTYDHYAVSPSVYDGLMRASSKGQYYTEYIKNIYRYRKL